MICDQTDRHIIQSVYLVFLAGKFTDLVADRFHRINIEDTVHILHNDRKTLQSHSGIDIFLGKFFITALAIAFKLGKYIVPDLHETVTVTAHLTIRASTAVFFSTVIVDLRAGTTRACAMLPEVVTLSGFRITVKTCDAVCRNTDLFCPDIKCLIIFSVNRRIEPVLLKTKYLG